ncbi:hypothetical protein [Butyrivibrio sp. WCD3002]|uniref:hypothetical protein n=1 Tax=Butyrivibrio sp. WCD3002 TaxID=1280676 RepID=UPI000416B363|nr:hypothetical protein [Butyrivibrio sp. WCD3002]
MHLFKEKKLPAYMTVEASFIVPAATFIMAFIIYLAFWFYGRCLLSQDVYILGFRAELLSKGQGYSSETDYVRDKAASKTGARYFGADKPVISASKSGDRLVTEGSFSTKTNAISGYFKALPSTFKGSARASVRLRDPAGKLRKYKRSLDVAKKVASKK